MITRDEINEKLGLAAQRDFAKEGNAKDFLIRMSSGTSTGQPLVSLRKMNSGGIGNSFRRDSFSNKRFESGFSRVVLVLGSKTHRLANALGILNSNHENIEILAIDASDINETIDAVLSSFQPDMLWGLPSAIVRTLSYIETEETLARIKYVRMSGEPLTPRVSKLLHNKMPHAAVAMNYGAAELGIILSQPCEYLTDNTYHPNPGVTPEVLTSDQTGIGEMVISKRISDSVVIERYAIGDMGRFIDNQCKCGAEKTIELLGRVNSDFIRIAGVIILRAEMDRIFSCFESDIENYFVNVIEHVHEDTISFELIVMILPSELIVDEVSIAAKVGERLKKEIFVTHTRVIEELIQEGVCRGVTVVCTQSLPKKGVKDIKMKKITYGSME